MTHFQISSDFSLKGDQPQAVEQLVSNIQKGKTAQVLLGITGSGKTFTMAHTIARLDRPALVLAHNKTLAAQLYQEFKEFFPNNAVEYFVSYYDYYQPEAYLPRTDTYIEKDLAINEEIDKMRLSATKSLIERRDVIIVASVSCIYGLGMPEHFAKMHILFKIGSFFVREKLFLRMVEMHYKRADAQLLRSTFRARGDIVEVYPSYETDKAYRIEFFDDKIERISAIDPLTKRVLDRVDSFSLYPASHFVTSDVLREKAIASIKEELEERVDFFDKNNLFAEKSRIFQRTMYDLEMIKEIGFCKGIENYSRHFSERKEGDPPATLLDYFPQDYLLFVDESHQMLPQVRAMYNGDRARKKTLVEYGFRLPSAFDNRPLKFEEFYGLIKQVTYVSATPAAFEIQEAKGEIIEQIIRPTGLLDPIIEIRPATGQVDDALEEIRKTTEKNERVLVTTLTKKLSEDISKYLIDVGVKAKYLHSEIVTLERMQILRELRMGVFEVLVGINLLREGLDLPEVSLVLILDADKEGFLRSETSLIQTCGRAARNAKGRVIMYADKMTSAIKSCVEITKKRRELQIAYNLEHGITPQTVIKKMSEPLVEDLEVIQEDKEEHITPKDLEKKIFFYKKKMEEAAKEFRFEDAAKYRDLMHKYQKCEIELG